MPKEIDPKSKHAIHTHLKAARDNQIIAGLEDTLRQEQHNAEQVRKLAWESRYKGLEGRIGFVLKRTSFKKTDGITYDGVVVEKSRIAQPVTIEFEGLHLTATWIQKLIKYGLFARKQVDQNTVILRHIDSDDPTINILAGRATLAPYYVEVPYHQELGIDNSLPYVIKPGSSLDSIKTMHELATQSIEPILTATEHSLNISIN